MNDAGNNPWRLGGAYGTRPFYLPYTAVPDSIDGVVIWRVAELHGDPSGIKKRELLAYIWRVAELHGDPSLIQSDPR